MRPPGAPSPTGNIIYWTSRACKNVKGQRPIGAEIYTSEKVHLGGSTCASITLLLVDQSTPNFFRPIGDEMHVVDQVLLRFSMRRSVQEIFAIKLKSC